MDAIAVRLELFERLGAAIVVAGLGGFACDVLFIVLTRRLVRWVEEMKSSFKVLALVVFNLVVGFLMVSPIFLLSFGHWNRSAIFNQMIGTTALVGLSNVFDAALASLFVLLALLLILHRAIWPGLTRTLFRMQDLGTSGRRGILVTVGLALLGWSGAKIPDLARELITALGNG